MAVAQPLLILVLTSVASIAFASCSYLNQGTGGVLANPPARAAKAYINALTADDIGPSFWEYGYKYNQQVREAQHKYPRAMWNDKVGAIQNAWRSEIEQQRKNSRTLSANDACWLVFRPSAQAEILETRAEDSETLENWKSFVKLVYTAENQPPLFRTTRGSRYLREATAVVNITRTDLAQDTLLVHDRCELIIDNLVFWPVPLLINNTALALVNQQFHGNCRTRN